jgi:hypothetical protein
VCWQGGCIIYYAIRKIQHLYTNATKQWIVQPMILIAILSNILLLLFGYWLIWPQSKIIQYLVKLFQSDSQTDSGQTRLTGAGKSKSRSQSKYYAKYKKLAAKI